MTTPEHITSRQNQRVKDAVKLRDRRARERSGRFLIDGIREIRRALESDIAVAEVFVCRELCRTKQAEQLAEDLRETTCNWSTVSPEVFEKLCFGQRQDGIVAVAETPERTLGDLSLPNEPLVVVIESLEKPGNVGAVLRSADGAGADAVIVASPRTDLYNSNTIRASLGAVFKSNVCTAPSEQVIGWIRDQELPVAAAQPGAAIKYHEFDFRAGAAIVLGSEAGGLSEVWKGASVTAVSLPMHGIADSLNVSATAAVLVYEAQRQHSI